ncbi:hypothetical protein CYMTET_36749 [Cymbomonas tetramitiformis]|uniref:Uncharacterized protein n=1 Tax=Cymbomonas tetramitiformis TaxID=36881 RepID=A0AAE0CHQ2_9CHLO|nr:hypothetical protein CYMTET_36749 [Cymbomonas tetramitiformis]
MPANVMSRSRNPLLVSSFIGMSDRNPKRQGNARRSHGPSLARGYQKTALPIAWREYSQKSRGDAGTRLTVPGPSCTCSKRLDLDATRDENDIDISGRAADPTEPRHLHSVGLWRLPPSTSRRGFLSAAPLLAVLTGLQAAMAAEARLEPLAKYIERLEQGSAQLARLGEEVAMLAATQEGEGGERDLAREYTRLLKQLHEGELGRFWANARAVDRYVLAVDPSLRGALAREQADMFELLPEKAGPLASLLRPNWDDPDDRLCLVYSCVNDPGAPISITTLYALKFLHVGLKLGISGSLVPGQRGSGGQRVRPEGLLFNVEDAQAKMNEYIQFAVEIDGKMDPSLLNVEGALYGVGPPPRVAEKFGGSPLE